MQVDDHKHVSRVGDEYVCSKCRRRWGIDERGADIPPCDDGAKSNDNRRS